MLAPYDLTMRTKSLRRGFVGQSEANALSRFSGLISVWPVGFVNSFVVAALRRATAQPRAGLA
jgi:hypothetical protein